MLGLGTSRTFDSLNHKSMNAALPAQIANSLGGSFVNGGGIPVIPAGANHFANAISSRVDYKMKQALKIEDGGVYFGRR